MAGRSATPHPDVSVILATNRVGSAPFLKTAVGSVLAQSHSNLELLIVDNGSPDADALRRILPEDSRVRTIRVDAIGVSRARNVGVGLARGALLAFIDDDDAWWPDRLSQHAAVMSADSQTVVSYCRMRTVDGDNRELVAGDQMAVRDIHDVYRRTTGILLPNMVIRRDAFVEVGGFDPVFRLAEDLDLLLRLALVGRVSFVDGPTLVDYRFHVGNTTRRHRELAGSIRSVLELHRWAAVQRGDRELAADLAESLKANDRFAAWSAARAARSMARSGEVGGAAGEMFWAVRFAPGAPFSWLRRRLARDGSGQGSSEGFRAGAAPSQD